MAKSAIDKDLKKLGTLEQTSAALSRSLAAPGLAVVFLVAVGILALTSVAQGPFAIYAIAAALIGGYMALYVGANDVANNVGPAVGARALTLIGALALAAVFEAAGAIVAGGDVIATISKSIVRPDPSMAAIDFILLMSGALFAAAMWVHLATYLGAPVSTTHAIVGGVLGAGLTALGPTAVSWPTMGAIAASWVISPIMGGAIAAALLWAVHATIMRRNDRRAAARQWIPVFVAVMAGVFAAYLLLKGLSRVWEPSTVVVWAVGLGAAVIGFAVTRPWLTRHTRQIDDSPKQVASLFVLPLIFAVALLCFAHGANDVANAVGPVAAVVAAAAGGTAAPADVPLPFWVLVVGATGISIGLVLFGPRVIRTVGEQITKMDPSRAYCVALAAAVTVLLASTLGLPVSSTHITVGGVFGVGFLREALSNKGIENPAVHPRTRFLDVTALNETPEDAVRRMRKREKRRLVRRWHVLTIGAAWIITVPAAGVLAALLYSAMRLALTR